MIEKAEQDGILKLILLLLKQQVKPGIELSWVGAAKGYKVVIVMPETMSVWSDVRLSKLMVLNSSNS